MKLRKNTNKPHLLLVNHHYAQAPVSVGTSSSSSFPSPKMRFWDEILDNASSLMLPTCSQKILDNMRQVTQATNVMLNENLGVFPCFQMRFCQHLDLVEMSFTCSCFIWLYICTATHSANVMAICSVHCFPASSLKEIPLKLLGEKFYYNQWLEKT